MNEQQKFVCRELLSQCYKHGFEGLYPLEPIAQKLGLTVRELYDHDTETGILWELGPYGEGLLEIGSRGTHAGVSMDTKEIVGHWSDFREY